MGTLKIKGNDILNYLTLESKNNVGTKHSAFPEKIRGLNADLDSKNKKVITGWLVPNGNGWSSNSDYDASQGKIKVNGTAIKVMYDGTRPRNMSRKATITGCGLTYYLNNVNGELYLSTAMNSASGTYIVRSRAPNKDCVVNMVCWGSGGKGGGGAYWFLAGNWGGVGGAGGGKAFFTICVKNNDYFRIVTETDDAKIGRLRESSNESFQSPGIMIYKSNGSETVSCRGGDSGTSNNPRWSTDSYSGGGLATVQSYSILPTISRKKCNGGAKRSNGYPGNSVTLGNVTSPYFGNPENNQGELVLTGNGGVGPDAAYAQGHGSGGGGSYGNGGNAGDTGSGSGGSPGSNGGGGGGGGSPSGGCSGGDGGLPGFIIFY